MENGFIMTDGYTLRALGSYPKTTHTHKISRALCHILKSLINWQIICCASWIDILIVLLSGSLLETVQNCLQQSIDNCTECLQRLCPVVLPYILQPSEILSFHWSEKKGIKKKLSNKSFPSNIFALIKSFVFNGEPLLISSPRCVTLWGTYLENPTNRHMLHENKDYGNMIDSAVHVRYNPCYVPNIP